MINDQFSGSCFCVRCVLCVRALTGRPAARSSSQQVCARHVKTKTSTSADVMPSGRGEARKVDNTLYFWGRGQDRCVSVCAGDRKSRSTHGKGIEREDLPRRVVEERRSRIDSEFCAHGLFAKNKEQPAQPKLMAPKAPDDLQFPFFRFGSSELGLCRLGRNTTRDWRHESRSLYVYTPRLPLTVLYFASG